MPSTILRARIVLPMSAPPIENGAVAVSGGRISHVGLWQDMSRGAKREVVDLGDSILMPGLVNAHCHLDYTGMAGLIPPPRKFVDWLKQITTNQAGMIYSDFAGDWLTGARMLLATGTTTLGDIEMVPELIPEVWSATPLRVISFLEMTGVKSKRPPSEILGEALARINSLPPGRSSGGLSPHAAYSTAPELLRITGETARRKKFRLATHVSESAEEFEMYLTGAGGMFDWLSLSGRDMADCGLGSPVQALDRVGYLCENLLAVHVNHLAPGDAELLGRRRVSVVHCPRSHSYFKHADFPLAELTAANVNICLGTDSLASVYKPRKQAVELNLFEEMREFAAKNPSLTAKTIVEMATANGARALGLAGQVGELSAGAFADLIAIPHSGKKADAFDAVINHRGNVSASMIGGEWAIAPGETARQGS